MCPHTLLHSQQHFWGVHAKGVCANIVICNVTATEPVARINQPPPLYQIPAISYMHGVDFRKKKKHAPNDTTNTLNLPQLFRFTALGFHVQLYKRRTCIIGTRTYAFRSYIYVANHGSARIQPYKMRSCDFSFLFQGMKESQDSYYIYFVHRTHR